MIAVGLPLTGLVDRRPALLVAAATGAERDPWRDAVRRHALSSHEASRLARDVPRGVAFDSPRLRRAAVDWATTLLEQQQPRPRTRVGRTLRVLLLLWVLAVLGLVLYRVLQGRPEDVNWVSVAMYGLLAVLIVRRRRRLHRTIELNAAPSPAAPQAGGA